MGEMKNKAPIRVITNQKGVCYRSNSTLEGKVLTSTGEPRGTIGKLPTVTSVALPHTLD